MLGGVTAAGALMNIWIREPGVVRPSHLFSELAAIRLVIRVGVARIVANIVRSRMVKSITCHLPWIYHQ